MEKEGSITNSGRWAQWRYKAVDPDCGIARIHVYPLGGLKRSAAWTYAVADGDFELNAKGNGFKVTRDVD